MLPLLLNYIMNSTCFAFSFFSFYVRNDTIVYEINYCRSIFWEGIEVNVNPVKAAKEN